MVLQSNSAEWIFDSDVCIIFSTISLGKGEKLDTMDTYEDIILSSHDLGPPQITLRMCSDWEGFGSLKKSVLHFFLAGVNSINNLHQHLLRIKKN